MVRKLTILLAVISLLTSQTFGVEPHGVAPNADVLFSIGEFSVTNSIATGWLVTLLIIIGVRGMVGTPRLIPTRGQAIIETMLSGLRDLVGPIIGQKAIHAAFPIIVGLFFYILLHNWSGLFPGVGTIGMGYVDTEGHFHLTRPFIRPANADWNGTIALAAVAMICWLFIILNPRFGGGFRVLLHDLFGNKADKKELASAMYWLLSGIFLIVGVIEVVSICIRPFTLSVRLFGNVFGGENLLHNTYFAFPFYFLELIVGLVQALVFILLVSVYIGLICNHGDDHSEEEHAGEAQRQTHAAYH